MDQLVHQITSRLCRKLNEEQPYYTPADLTEAGMPDFLVSRIRLELEHNLRDSIVPPDSDWASMSAPDVRQAWALFLDAINGQVRLPHAFTRGVVESAVADLVDLLSQPLAHYPPYLFGTASALSYEEVQAQMRLVVVYPHLGLFLPRYMLKRGLNEISIDTYRHLLTQLDSRVCRNYSPLNWVQLLEPLFTLCGGEVEGELLARFFTEKKLPDQARWLRQIQDPLDSQQLVELLSRPVYRYDEPEAEAETDTTESASPQTEPEPKPEDDEPSRTDSLKTKVIPGSIAGAAFRESGPKKASSPTEQTAQHEDATVHEPTNLPEQSAEPHGSESEPQERPKNPSDEFENDGAPQGEDEQDVPLYQRLALDDDDNDDDETEADDASEHALPQAPAESGHPDTEDEGDEPDEPLSLPRFRNEESYPEEATEDASHENIRPIAGSETEGDIDDDDDDDEDNIPLWQRLRVDDDENEAEPHPPQTIGPAPDNARFEELYSFLQSDEDRFLREIFDSDRRAYIGALEQLSGFDNWRKAGKYLTNEIFRRYEIDMYKDVSIDFTDQLHRFFKNHA